MATVIACPVCGYTPTNATDNVVAVQHGPSGQHRIVYRPRRP